MRLVVHCADIGSVAKGNFGWARLALGAASGTCSTGTDIQQFVDVVAADLNRGAHVALGFECPLFVPLPQNPIGLTAGRPGEGNRAWSAGAGAGALATGLTETVWILSEVRRRVPGGIPVSVDWSQFHDGPPGLFIWEAFVTNAAKADTHHGAAELAVLTFRDALPDPAAENAVCCTEEVRSLFGAALLQAAWSTDLAWLQRQCLVLRTGPKTA